MVLYGPAGWRDRLLVLERQAGRPGGAAATGPSQGRQTRAEGSPAAAGSGRLEPVDTNGSMLVAAEPPLISC